MKRQTLFIFLSFAAIYFIWGTTYLAIVIGLETIPPFTMAALRFLIASVLLIAYSMLKKEPFPTYQALLKNAVIGITVLAGGQGLLIWSEQYIASGYASILLATLPIWFVLIDRKNWSFYFKSGYILSGILLGLTGIGILFGEKLLADSSSINDAKMQLFASLLVLTGAVCWVGGTLYNRSQPASGSIHKNLGYQLFFGFLSCLLIAFLLEEPVEELWIETSARSLLASVYLSVAGSIIAYVAYTWLLTQMPSAIVGTYAYVNPIVAVLLGWLVADELITQQQLIGMIIILVSAVLINVNRSKT